MFAVVIASAITCRPTFVHGEANYEEKERSSSMIMRHWRHSWNLLQLASFGMKARQKIVLGMTMIISP